MGVSSRWWYLPQMYQCTRRCSYCPAAADGCRGQQCSAARVIYVNVPCGPRSKQIPSCATCATIQLLCLIFGHVKCHRMYLRHQTLRASCRSCLPRVWLTSCHAPHAQSVQLPMDFVSVTECTRPHVTHSTCFFRLIKFQPQLSPQAR